MTSRGIRHIPALDGLRGLAVAGVLLFHAGHLRGGFLGVDLFFVLSGFLITSLLVNEWGHDERLDLGAFWARRARRLLPALFGVLAGVLLYASVFAAPEELGRIQSDALATLGYVANWGSIFGGHGYWDAFSAPSPLEHTWSLAIEEQFYLLWPLVVLAVLHFGRGRLGRLLGVTVGLTLASSALMFVLYRPGADPSRVYLGTDTRAAGVLAGAALAVLLAMRGPIRGRAGRIGLEALALVGAAITIVAWTTTDGSTEGLYRGGFLVCQLAVLALIASAAHPRRGPVAVALSWRPLRALGLVSYGLYLWHWPVYVVLNPARTGLDGWTLVTLRVGVSLAFAVVSYHLLEQPIRRGALRGWRLKVLAPATAVVLVGALVVATSGGTAPRQLAFDGERSTPPTIPISDRIGQAEPADDTTIAGAQARRADEPRTSRRETSSSAGSSSTTTTAPPAPPRVLVVGDSVAMFFGDSFAALSGEYGIEVANVAFAGCGLNDGPRQVRSPGGIAEVQDPSDCSAHWSQAVEQFRPDVTLMVLPGPAIADWSVGGAWIHPCQPEFDRWYESRLGERLETLLGDGGAVALASVPRVDLLWGPGDVNDRVACLNDLQRRVAERLERVAVVDLAEHVCPGGACRTEENGALIRPDALHFHGPGADGVNRWLLQRSLEVAAFS